eukprot:scaffold2642_cov120-Cylindrotheca_fusiformis.AAC.12
MARLPHSRPMKRSCEYCYSETSKVPKFPRLLDADKPVACFLAINPLHSQKICRLKRSVKSLGIRPIRTVWVYPVSSRRTTYPNTCLVVKRLAGMGVDNDIGRTITGLAHQHVL